MERCATESDRVEGREVGILAEVAFLVGLPRKGVSTVTMRKNPKTMSPIKIGDIRGS